MNREAQIYFVRTRAHEVASWAAPCFENGYVTVDLFIESATADLERLTDDADDNEMREIYTATVLSWFRHFAHKAHKTHELRQAVRKVFGGDVSIE
jgi:hypothetical protein